jgi:hypothetical protein
VGSNPTARTNDRSDRTEWQRRETAPGDVGHPVVRPGLNLEADPHRAVGAHWRLRPRSTLAATSPADGVAVGYARSAWSGVPASVARSLAVSRTNGPRGNVGGAPTPAARQAPGGMPRSAR